NLRKTGSFKMRGASNAILSLTEQEAARGIVTQSSGNHGAAVACAAAWRGIPAWIVMPRNAPAVKAKAIEGYGGKVVFCEPTVTARKATCDHVQAETSAHLVHPYDDDRIIVVGMYQRSEEHTSELQSRFDLVCRLLLEKKKHTRPLQKP